MKIKKISIKILIIFILVYIFLCCKNNKKNDSNDSQKLEESAVVFDSIDEVMINEKNNSNLIDENRFFAGLIGKDSIFIESEEEGYQEWRKNIVVFIGKNILYMDMDDNLFYINNLDAKNISLKSQDMTYILLTLFDAPFADKWLILKVQNKRVTETYKVIKGNIFNDIDNDGFFEIGGRELSESPCNKIPCDSIYYVPFEIYKLNETLEFDSINSEKLTFMLYGTFLGFDNKDTVLYVDKGKYNSILEIMQ